jgi:hypothetical protein
MDGGMQGVLGILSNATLSRCLEQVGLTPADIRRARMKLLHKGFAGKARCGEVRARVQTDRCTQPGVAFRLSNRISRAPHWFQ